MKTIEIEITSCEIAYFEKYQWALKLMDVILMKLFDLGYTNPEGKITTFKSDVRMSYIVMYYPTKKDLLLKKFY